MSERFTVGELVARFLEHLEVRAAFGVISIHNMPILDAIGQRERIRFVPARGEAGAANMADACARVRGGVGVCITSTGTGAGNAAGALIEAQTAGTPLLHITGQIETPHLDREHGFIHAARDQLGMLRALGKAALRVDTPDEAAATLHQAATLALSAPAGVVSVEIPIDVQEATIEHARFARIEPIPLAFDPGQLDRIADRLAACRRPLLWVGGGAKHTGSAVSHLLDCGFALVTSTQGRGVVPEHHRQSLGAFTLSPSAQALYRSCDAVVVAGSHLRGNETLKYTLPLPRPLYRIDANPDAADHPYAADEFVHGDANTVLPALADRLRDRMLGDPSFAAAIEHARETSIAQLKETLGPYQRLLSAVEAAAGESFVWVRDITISNSTWGNRCLRFAAPGSGVHAAGGGIGQAVPMAIGASCARPRRQVFCLVGDGGLQLALGELASAVQEKSNIVFIVMNSASYAVIRNIQDVKFGGRHYFTDLHTPDFGGICASIGMPHEKLASLQAIERALHRATNHTGPAMLEIDMPAVGDFAKAFAGPPVAAKPRENKS